MSREAMAWVRRQNIVDPTLMSILRVVALRADASGTCWPSQAYIAQECGLSDRSVRRALATLETLEILRRKARSNGRSGRTTDLIALALQRDFDLGRGVIKAVRAASSTGHSVRLDEKLQPDTVSSATGHSVQGINKDQTSKNLAKGKTGSAGQVSPYTHEHLADAARRGLRVVAGGLWPARAVGEVAR